MDTLPPDKSEIERNQGVLSKVLGAGVGSSIIVAAKYFNLSPDWQGVIMAAAPWATICIAWIGPISARFALDEIAIYKLRFHVGRLKKLAASCQDETVKAESLQGAAVLEKAIKHAILKRAGFSKPSADTPIVATLPAPDKA